jgi:hypothetical protein
MRATEEASFPGRCRSHCNVADPNPRLKTQPFIEAVHARVCSPALHKHMVAVFHPSVSQRGVNHGFAMTSAPQLGMGDNVLQKSVVSSFAQQVWCNDKHASRGDPI